MNTSGSISTDSGRWGIWGPHSSVCHSQSAFQTPKVEATPRATRLTTLRLPTCHSDVVNNEFFGKRFVGSSIGSQSSLNKHAWPWKPWENVILHVTFSSSETVGSFGGPSQAMSGPGVTPQWPVQFASQFCFVFLCRQPPVHSSYLKVSALIPFSPLG